MGSSVTAVRSETFEADKRAVEGVRQKESENDSHVQGTTPEKWGQEALFVKSKR